MNETPLIVQLVSPLGILILSIVWAAFMAVVLLMVIKWDMK